MQIRKAAIEDYFKILSIADDQLGKGYMKGVLVQKLGNHIWVAEESDSKDIIGFVFVIVKENIALIKSIAIREGAQRMGVGTSLINKAFQQLRDRVSKFQVIAWEHADSKTIPLARLLDKFGFEESRREIYAWYEDSVRRGYECPTCGNPCQCNAVIFSIPSSYFSGNIG